MGRLMAMAPFVRTQADADRLMQAVATSPDVQPSGWQDALSRDYVKRAQAQVAALMPKGLGRGPKPVTALDRLRMEELRQRIATSKSLENQRNARIKAAQDKADKKLRASGLRGGGTDKAVLDNLRGHRRFYDAYQEGSGEFSSAAIAARLDRRHGQTGQYDESDISAERERLWRGLTGQLADDDSTSVELNALSLLKSKRAKKAAADTADDIARAAKEERIARQAQQRQDLSEQRAYNIEASKARQYNLSVQRLLGSAEARAAKAKYSKDVLEGMDEADAIKLYSGTLDDIARRSGGVRSVPAGEATADDPLVIEEIYID